MAGRRSAYIGKIIAVAIAILLLLALVGGLVMYLRGNISKDDITDLIEPKFRVTCDNQSYYTDSDNTIMLPSSGKLQFYIINADSVTVEVVPDIDFDFKVNGEEHHFFENEKITGAFISTNDVYGGYFFIDCDKHNFDVVGILKDLYGENALIEVGELQSTAIARLVVKSNNGETISIKLQCSLSGILGVELDHNEIVF